MREHLTAEDLRELGTLEDEYALGQTWLQLAQALKEADRVLAKLFGADLVPEAA